MEYPIEIGFYRVVIWSFLSESGPISIIHSKFWKNNRNSKADLFYHRLPRITEYYPNRSRNTRPNARALKPPESNAVNNDDHISERRQQRWFVHLTSCLSRCFYIIPFFLLSSSYFCVSHTKLTKFIFLNPPACFAFFVCVHALEQRKSLKFQAGPRQ